MQEHSNTQHVSVLLSEAIDGLSLERGDVLLDGTFGAGGHTRYALETHPDITVIALDQDIQAIEKGREEFGERVTFVQGNFSQLDTVLEDLGIKAIDACLLDLGTSVDQIKTSGRGFTFEKDEPLQMTLSQEGEMTAKDIVNAWSEETLTTIFRIYGGERFARRIARGIIEAREQKPIETTLQLVDIIKASTPSFYHRKKIHPATKTFQALRIAVNDEITALKQGLRKGVNTLSSGGRMAVIAFHSLEDREVKRFFRDAEQRNEGKRITKKPLTASDEERQQNPRSRSAKLRIFQKA